MGVLLGLAWAAGLLLIAQAWLSGPRGRAPRRSRLREALAEAGLAQVTPARLVASCLGVAAVAGLAMAAVSRSPVVAATFGLLAGYLPVALVGWRRRKRADELRDLWPDLVDNLGSAVRAGLSLPEALTQLGTRGPEQLRGPFARFGEDYRATGRFGESLDRLKESLADPVADRIVESLRVAREVGGSDLGRLLRTLSAFLRDDARTRAELQSRQAWTVNAARLAVAAPWVLLALLSLRPQAVAAYNSPAGVVVLVGGAGLCVVAYRVMMRVGRLPREERVLR
jgi:tight adherence protein B